MTVLNGFYNYNIHIQKNYIYTQAILSIWFFKIVFCIGVALIKPRFHSFFECLFSISFLPHLIEPMNSSPLDVILCMSFKFYILHLVIRYFSVLIVLKSWDWDWIWFFQHYHLNLGWLYRVKLSLKYRVKLSLKLWYNSDSWK